MADEQPKAMTIEELRELFESCQRGEPLSKTVYAVINGELVEIEVTKMKGKPK